MWVILMKMISKVRREPDRMPSGTITEIIGQQEAQNLIIWCVQKKNCSNFSARSQVESNIVKAIYF